MDEWLKRLQVLESEIRLDSEHRRWARQMALFVAFVLVQIAKGVSHGK